MCAQISSLGRAVLVLINQLLVVQHNMRHLALLAGLEFFGFILDQRNNFPKLLAEQNTIDLNLSPEIPISQVVSQ